MYYPKFIFSYQKEESISIQSVIVSHIAQYHADVGLVLRVSTRAGSIAPLVRVVIICNNDGYLEVLQLIIYSFIEINQLKLT